MAARNNPSKGPKFDKLWRDALMLEIKAAEKEKKPTRSLRVIAQTVLDAAASGDMAAVKEIGDRIDGKPTQAMQHQGSLVMEHIERLIVSSSDPDS